MCRLFGFRSVISSQVHSSLISAENALALQSGSHPDGWGVAYYASNAPHLIKSSNSAINCNIFKKVSGVVSSNTVMAHIRKATLGEKTILNTHPFQFGQWTFSHNGNIKHFDTLKKPLLSLISERFKPFILGDTDSEIIFYILLSFIEKRMDLSSVYFDFKRLSGACREAITEIISITGEYNHKTDAGNTETYYSFILTNGHAMIAHQGGQELFYSTYKDQCPERDICPKFSNSCESPVTKGPVNHLIFSSERLSGENIWTPMAPGDIVGVDHQMNLQINP